MARHKRAERSICQPAKQKQVVFLLAAWLCGLAGCGDSSGLDVAPVTGVVTLDGKPVDKAGIVFRPDFGPVATAASDAEGRFRLMTGNEEGAVVGEHRISVTKGQTSELEEGYGGTMGAPTHRKKQSKPQFGVPERYGQVTTSGLKATIKRGEENRIDLLLTTKDPQK